MFNTFLCDLFLEDESNYFTNFADNTTPYFIGITIAEVLENLPCLTKKLFSRFENNKMIANDDKCHLFLSSFEEDAAIQTDESRIKCFKVKELLGIYIDYKFKFDTHADTTHKKSHRKLARITKYMELPKRHILTNTLFKA